MSTFISIKKISLVLVGCFIAGIASAKNISFSDNQMISVNLSSTNVNRIVVPNDQITNIICPTNFCTSKHNSNDVSGAAYVQLLTQNPFTLFVSTSNGHHVSLSVTPTNSNGKTLVLNPLSSSLKAEAWETESSYRTLLITLVRDMMNGTTPSGYGFTAISHCAKTKIFHGKFKWYGVAII
ncbi:MAG: type-F conjugative transfer system secretin TraK [Gammaproteobacteria bacterium]|nr:type-F conjugative transfer system secretin TraK [Gammaproteobacteria bacterium]